MAVSLGDPTLFINALLDIIETVDAVNADLNPDAHAERWRKVDGIVKPSLGMYEGARDGD